MIVTGGWVTIEVVTTVEAGRVMIEVVPSSVTVVVTGGTTEVVVTVVI